MRSHVYNLKKFVRFWSWSCQAWFFTIIIKCGFNHLEWWVLADTRHVCAKSEISELSVVIMVWMLTWMLFTSQRYKNSHTWTWQFSTHAGVFTYAWLKLSSWNNFQHGRNLWIHRADCSWFCVVTWSSCSSAEKWSNQWALRGGGGTNSVVKLYIRTKEE